MKFTWKQITDFFANSSFFEKIKAKTMTNEDWDSVNAEFKEKHGIDLNAAITAAKKDDGKVKKLEASHQAAIEALFAGDAGDGGEGGEGPAAAGDGGEGGDGGAPTPSGEGGEGGEPAAGADVNLAQEITALKEENKSFKSQIAALGKNGEPASGKKVTMERKKLALCGPGNTATHLFGIEDPLFAMEKSWNVNASNMTYRTKPYASEEITGLKKEFDSFATEVSDRYKTLLASGQLATMLAGNLDYSTLEGELGAYYRVRRQDAIISYIKNLKSLASIFPVHYGVQDEEVLTNVFEGKSFSQSFQSGRVFAGKFKFEPLKAKVKDVMFKYKFSDLKDLERQYIGYLNTEGSDPIKWGFIEWIMVMCAKIQVNEREQRRVRGFRVESTSTKPAHFMYASDGILTTLDKMAEAAKPTVWVYADKNAYTTSTLLDYVRDFVRTVYRMHGGLDGWALFMNELDVPDFKEAYREKYGTDANYSGEKVEVKDFPLPKIVGIPNMGPLRQDMILMEEGRVEILENEPGEFFAYRFQLDFEEVYAMSYCKEGTHAYPGKQFANKAALIADKGRHTRIFMNNPATLLVADATTCDGSTNEIFQTIANTGATAITDVTNAVEGIVYKIICGATANATTIAKANKFSTITAAYTPTAVGDYIKVIYDPTDEKFIELERKVGGTLTVNAAAKAPEYVEA